MRYTIEKVVPIRMVPLVLGGTLISHLFGASVGREGTAVQMGALADQLTHIFKVKKDTRRILLMAGMSAGFSSVFGTPMAGAIFGMEVLAIGRIRYDALFPVWLPQCLPIRSVWHGGYITHITASISSRHLLYGVSCPL
jgi:H+/Cl- antiporter ClcA